MASTRFGPIGSGSGKYSAALALAKTFNTRSHGQITGNKSKMAYPPKYKDINDEYGVFDVKENVINNWFDDYDQLRPEDFFTPYDRVERMTPDEYQLAFSNLETLEEREERVIELGEKYRRQMRVMAQFALQWQVLMNDIADDEKLKELFDEFMIVRKLRAE